MAEVRVERTEDGFRAVNARGAEVAIGDGDAAGVFTPVELLLERGHRMARLAATVQADKVATSTLGTITVTYDVELPEGDAKAEDVLKAVAARVHERYCTVGEALREPKKVEQVV